jgi:sialic acid synthase SpsE
MAMTVIFELGLNHQGDVARAKRMLDALAQNGAMHVTVQVITGPASMTRNPDSIGALTKNGLSFDDNIVVIRYAKSLGLTPGATLVDPEHVPGLVAAGVRFFKILSSDLTYEDLVSATGASGLPVYISTGASTVGEIGEALERGRVKTPSADLRLIHTVLQVPTPAGELNLLNIVDLQERYKVPVAYGQHSDIPEALLVATTLGAQAAFVYVAEARDPGLLDGPHAVLCADAGAVIQRVRQAEAMLGVKERRLSEKDEGIRKAVRRSIVARHDLASGVAIGPEHLAFKRPGTGLSPWEAGRLLGQKLERTFAVDEDLIFETRGETSR